MANFNGTFNPDAFTGTADADTFYGDAGNDTLTGFGAGDQFDGAADLDIIVVASSVPALAAAADGDIINVEAVSAMTARAAVAFSLAGQSEGFAITGSKFGDTITGSGGNDVFVGFVGADSVDGGDGTDTIELTATSTALNSAADLQLSNIEVISARGATAGVTIDVRNQIEGNTILGSRFGDVIFGNNAAANDISSGDGNDTIHGFNDGDRIDGGAGIDTLVLTATSLDLNSEPSFDSNILRRRGDFGCHGDHRCGDRSLPSRRQFHDRRQQLR